MSTTISVTVPALNEEENIQSLLESFRNQTNKEFEVIIVDNGSTDATKDMVNAEIALNHYPLKLLIEEKKGVGFARRKGMDDAAARNIPYLAGTDADSMVPSDWIETIVETFNATHADCLFGFALLNLDRLKSRPELYALVHDAWTVRQAFARRIDIPARGVNFAITSSMYQKIGGMPQPQNEDGFSLPGEDIALRKMVESNEGKVAVIDSEVTTSPRRILRALVKDSPNDYYKDFEDVRGEDILSAQILSLGMESIEKFVNDTLKRTFAAYIVKNIDMPLWERAKEFIHPEENAFVADARTMEPEELYRKYKEIVIANAKKLIS